jgi:hypothetical protein
VRTSGGRVDVGLRRQTGGDERIRIGEFGLANGLIRSGATVGGMDDVRGESSPYLFTVGDNGRCTSDQFRPRAMGNRSSISTLLRCRSTSYARRQAVQEVRKWRWRRRERRKGSSKDNPRIGVPAFGQTQTRRSMTPSLQIAS